MTAIRISFALFAMMLASLSWSSQDTAPQRLVVISPAIAEMLHELELGDRIVGIGEFGPWPAEIAGLPIVGGYDSPNVEQIIRLRADAVLNAKSQAAAAAHHRLHSVGIEVLALDTSTYEGVFATLQQLGERFDRREKAQAIAGEINQDTRVIRELSRELPKPRVLFVVGRDPVYVAGPGSHVDVLVTMAGGQNVASDAPAPYQQFSLETILERRPQIIIDSSLNGAGALRGRVAGHWRKWPLLPAVRDDRVYWVDPSQVVIPGIRLASMARLLGRFIHPEVFGEPGPEDFAPHTGNGDAVR